MDRQSSDPAPGRDPDDGTPGGQEPEKVEDRPSVGTLEPEDYPDPATGDAQ